MIKVEQFTDVDSTQRFKRAVIDAATSGDNTIIAAVAGKKLRVYQLVLISAGTVTTRWESGTAGNFLSGEMTLAVNTGYAPPWCPAGHFETVAGEALNLQLSGAVSVDGWLVYAEI